MKLIIDIKPLANGYSISAAIELVRGFVEEHRSLFNGVYVPHLKDIGKLIEENIDDRI